MATRSEEGPPSSGYDAEPTYIGRANAEAFSELLFLLLCRGWCGLNLAIARRGGLWPGFTFMAHVRAAQKRHFVETVLLEQFEPEINHRRHKKRDHLRESQGSTPLASSLRF